MKTRSILLVLLFTMNCIFLACNNEAKSEVNTTETQATKKDLPVMSFKEEKHNFGEIIQGEKVSYSFIFKNVGGSDLLISSASGSCGCTVPTFPKEPVKAGQEAKIDVVFDSDGKSGLVEKTVTLVSNCDPSNTLLTINANIIVPDKTMSE